MYVLVLWCLVQKSNRMMLKFYCIAFIFFPFFLIEWEKTFSSLMILCCLGVGEARECDREKRLGIFWETNIFWTPIMHKTNMLLKCGCKIKPFFVLKERFIRYKVAFKLCFFVVVLYLKWKSLMKMENSIGGEDTTYYTRKRRSYYTGNFVIFICL